MIGGAARRGATDTGPELRIDLGLSIGAHELRATDRPAFATSPAYDTILRELGRYLDDQIRGRSFLVAGHRGSGKTSMVLRAIEDLRDRALAEGFDPDRPRERPLAVRLQGPALLAGLKQAAAQASEGGVRTQTTAVLMQQILSQLMISTYRELTAEVVRAYRKRMEDLAGDGAVRPDTAELVGQLALALDNAPPPEELREFWRRAGAMERGLFWPADVEGRELAGARRPEHQGTLELVAVSTAAQAYRVVSGEVSYSDGTKDEASRSESVETAASLQGKDIADKALAVLTGGLAGGAWMAQDGQPDPLIAVVIGLATAVLAGVTFKYTGKRERKRSRTAEYSFIRKRDISTLDRELPVVIRRIREAGLAPVFVVDELDKIGDELDDAMAELVRRLKHIVADRFFFCFLTDRDYFERLEKKSRDLPYPQEHTYFSQRLFILYRPENLHRYLDNILKSDEEPFPTDNGPTAVFRALLSRLLLHRAKLHAFDLQRELSHVSDEYGNITVLLRELRSHYGYRFHIAMQLAVEYLLDEDEMRDRIDQEPYFGQFAHDALYYLSREWQRGAREIDLSDDAIDAYLAGRIDPERFARMAGAAANGNGDGTPALTAPELVAQTLAPTDREALHENVHRLARLLAHPAELAAALASTLEPGEVSQSLIAVIPAEEDDEPLLALSGDGTAGAWAYDYFGRSLKRARRAAADGIDAEIAAALELGRRLRDAEAQFQAASALGFGDLAPLGLLGTSPDWLEVEATLDRLTEIGASSAAADEGQVQSEIQMVHEFERMLLRRTPLLIMTLTVALELRRIHGDDRPVPDYLGAVSGGMGLTMKTREQAAADMAAVVRPINADLDPDAVLSDLDQFLGGLDDVMKWAQSRGPEGDLLERHVDSFWDTWESRLRDEGDRPGDYPVTLDELVVLSSGEPDADLVIEGLRERTVRGLLRLYGAAVDKTNAWEVDGAWTRLRVPNWVILFEMLETGSVGLLRVIRDLLADDPNALAALPNVRDGTPVPADHWILQRIEQRERNIRLRVLFCLDDVGEFVARLHPFARSVIPDDLEVNIAIDHHYATTAFAQKYVPELEHDMAIYYPAAYQGQPLSSGIPAKQSVLMLDDPDLAATGDIEMPVIRTPGSIAEAVYLVPGAVRAWRGASEPQTVEKAPPSAAKRGPRRRK